MEILEIFYLVLIIFTIIIGTLLSIVLVKLIKVLNMLVEIANYYAKVKQILSLYSHIPHIIKDKIKSFFSH